MSVILITGSTGFLGSRLVKRLCESGHRVRAMVVNNDPMIHRLKGINCEIVTGDISDPATLDSCMKGVRCVFHLAAILVSDEPGRFHQINYIGTKNVVDAAVKAGVVHFNYVSAAAASYKKRTTYGETKFLSEQLMKEKKNTTNFTIFRPTLLYGPGGGGQELVIYIEQLRKFKWCIPMVGSGKALKRWVCVDDVIEGLSLAVNKPVSYGKIYNLGGGSAHSMREFTVMLCQQLGIQKRIVPVPVTLCRSLACILNAFQRKPILKSDTILGVTMDADFSIEEAQKDLGYNPIGFKEGLKRCFDA